VRAASKATRALCAFAFVVTASLLALAEGSAAAARRVQGAPEGEVCSFRVETGAPCLGCGGTAAFGHAARGRFARAAVANPLGAWAGAAAWVLLAASGLTLAGAGTGFLRAALLGIAATLPAAFVVNAIAWWTSLPR
jgi:hypothetical protein